MLNIIKKILFKKNTKKEKILDTNNDFEIKVIFNKDKGLFVETNINNSSVESANLFSEVIIGMTRGVFFPAIHECLRSWAQNDPEKKQFCNVILENINKEIEKLNEEDLITDNLCVHPEDVFGLYRKEKQ